MKKFILLSLAMFFLAGCQATWFAVVQKDDVVYYAEGPLEKPVAYYLPEKVNPPLYNRQYGIVEIEKMRSQYVPPKQYRVFVLDRESCKFETFMMELYEMESFTNQYKDTNFRRIGF